MKVSLFVVIACLNSGDGFYDHSSLSSILSAYKARLKISRFEAVSVSATTAALTNPVDLSPVEEQFPVENHIPVEDQSPVEEQFPVENHTLVEDQSPVEKQFPVEDQSPVEEQFPVENHIPVEIQTPVDQTSKDQISGDGSPGGDSTESAPDKVRPVPAASDIGPTVVSLSLHDQPPVFLSPKCGTQAIGPSERSLC